MKGSLLTCLPKKDLGEKKKKKRQPIVMGKATEFILGNNVRVSAQSPT